VADDRWRAFVDWSRRALAKPTFDAEERDYRVAVASAGRELIAVSADGQPLGDLANALEERAMSSRYTLLPARALAELSSWSEHDPDGLSSALRALLAAGDDPTRRLEGFLAEATRARGGEFEIAALLIGSLLNFALSPHDVPVVRSARYASLRERLGKPFVPASSLLEAYARDLAFAGEIDAALRAGGVGVRDMQDVDALIRIADTEQEFWAGEGDAADSRRTSEPDVYLAVCALYRNEAPYLAEWIEFHRLVGVERFYLYDNSSDDHHLQVLARYLDEGTVVRHEWPAEITTGPELGQAQRGAYEHCLRAHGEEARWIAAIDVDLFLFSPTGRTVSELLTEFERWPAVAVNTRYLGPSDRVSSASTLVVERHTRVADPWDGRIVKSIVDPCAVTGCLSSHRFECRRGVTVDENGYAVLPVRSAQSASPSFARLQINHYFARSDGEFREKLPRRMGYPRQRALLDGRPSDADEHDTTIHRYVPPLRDALQRRRSGRDRRVSPEESGDARTGAVHRFR
jgi:Glycosyltransferase family 92